MFITCTNNDLIPIGTTIAYCNTGSGVAGVNGIITFTETELQDMAAFITSPDYSPISSGFDLTTIDAATATAMFTAGFILVVLPSATAYGFSKLLQLLR